MKLCKLFPALTPFSIRRTKASEVFLLIDRLSDYNEKEYIRNGGKKGDKVVIRNGEQVVFRPASHNSPI